MIIGSGHYYHTFDFFPHSGHLAMASFQKFCS